MHRNDTKAHTNGALIPRVTMATVNKGTSTELSPIEQDVFIGSYCVIEHAEKTLLQYQKRKMSWEKIAMTS